jgi:hypothetical protein
MNQALYAHMNNKRKREKKNTELLGIPTSSQYSQAAEPLPMLYLLPGVPAPDLPPWKFLVIP